MASHVFDRTAEARLAVLDAHCHVDLFLDPSAVVKEAESLGIRTIAVTNAPSVFTYTRDLTATCRFVRPAIGLHPELVCSHGHELELFWPFLEETRYVGEIGLDYVTTDPEIRARQRHVFSTIVERCAARGDRILTIHSRRAVADVLATVGEAFPGKAILHWFSGSPKQLERAATAGFYFSVNPAMMVSRSGRALTATMPRDRVLTETDGPFVKTVRGPATPPDTAGVITSLASIWGIQPQEARDIISRNLRGLVGSPDASN